VNTNTQTDRMNEVMRKVELILECYKDDEGELMGMELATSYVFFVDRTIAVIAEVFKQDVTNEQFALLDALFDEGVSTVPQLKPKLSVV